MEPERTCHESCASQWKKMLMVRLKGAVEEQQAGARDDHGAELAHVGKIGEELPVEGRLRQAEEGEAFSNIDEQQTLQKISSV